jgi:hypothetical protein
MNFPQHGEVFYFYGQALYSFADWLKFSLIEELTSDFKKKF